MNYFGSFTQDAGFKMVVLSGKFCANYEVDVLKVNDDLSLIRRPVANWVLRGLQSELEKVSTDLVSNLPETEDILQKEIDDDIIDIERQSRSYFLFSVKRYVLPIAQLSVTLFFANELLLVFSCTEWFVVMIIMIERSRVFKSKLIMVLK